MNGGSGTGAFLPLLSSLSPFLSDPVRRIPAAGAGPAAAVGQRGAAAGRRVAGGGAAWRRRGGAAPAGRSRAAGRYGEPVAEEARAPRRWVARRCGGEVSPRRRGGAAPAGRCGKPVAEGARVRRPGRRKVRRVFFLFVFL